MIVGLGLDVVAVARIEGCLGDGGSAFEGRVFTPAERSECEGRADRLHALAARFAAKEACFKALGTGRADGVGFQQVEVTSVAGGAPMLSLRDGAAARAAALGVRRTYVTLTHEREVAAAVVILEA